MSDQNNDKDQKEFSAKDHPVEGEDRSRNRSAEDAPEDNDGIYLTGDSKLQSKEEFELDKNREGGEDELTISSADDHESNSGGVGGTDRAGTAERKDYGEPKLNKGLEDQEDAQTTYEE